MASYRNHDRRPTRRAFTLIELLVVISIIALLIAILLPALGAAREASRKLKSATQLRGLHQAMVIHANDNKEYYTGLNSKGADLDSADCGNSGEGVTVEARYWILLDGDYLTKDILISPGEVDAREDWLNGDPITLRHYSYAMLLMNNAAAAPGGTGVNLIRSATSDEWRATGNTLAPITSDRNTSDIIGNTNVYSVWTQSYGGDWEGNILWNDNHVTFENTFLVEKTQYGAAETVYEDHIFATFAGAGGVPNAGVGIFENAQMIKYGARASNDNGTSPEGAY